MSTDFSIRPVGSPAPSPIVPPFSQAAGKTGGDVAIDVDQRFELRGIRIHLHLDGLLQHEDADIGDVLPDIQRVRILVGLGLGQEDRP